MKSAFLEKKPFSQEMLRLNTLTICSIAQVDHLKSSFVLNLNKNDWEYNI